MFDPHAPPPPVDALNLAQQLIRCPSVTPKDAGAMAVLAAAARRAGFTVETFTDVHAGQPVQNLIARRGTGSPSLAFTGHVDVVPPGPAASWRHPPFAGVVAEGRLHGRGAVDMKGALAAFLAAASNTPQARGTLSLLVTGDEEDGGPAGMRALLAHLQAQGPLPDVALIGEASNEGEMGEGMRIGRRGSLHATLRAEGIQGHVAWPQKARNALHLLLDACQAVRRLPLAPAHSVFPASSLQITQLHCANDTGNVIPGAALAKLNLRFNPGDDGGALAAAIVEAVQKSSPFVTVETSISGEPYLSEAPQLVAALLAACRRVLGRSPEQNAGGGTSDGRFLQRHFPVVEFGLVGDLAHQVNESVPIAELHQLQEVYAATLENFFSSSK